MHIGIDLGTSEVKAVLVDDDQRIVASAGSGLVVSRPQPLHSEQAPDDWWHATEAALAQLRAAAPPGAWAAVRAIGLAGQMHGAVLVDAQDRVLRPAILWNDGRSEAACRALEAAVPRLGEITGNRALAGFTAPKLWWLREHEPAVFARLDAVLLPKDWLRLRLTGERASDCSDASGTLWLDVARRRWSDEVLAACGLDVARMPRLVEGSEAAGALRREVAQRWGLRPGLPVAGGGGDNAASAVGIGAVEPGQGLLSLGTSGVVFVAGDRFLPQPASALHAFCHALPARWHQMSVMLSAASCLPWAAALTGLDVPGLLDAAASLDASARARAPLFLPYLSGERTPHGDAHARGVAFGLNAQTDRAALAYAVVEGVGFGLLDGLNALSGPGAVAPSSLALVGGGTRSAWWSQLLATTFGLPLTLHEGAAASAALGAAKLAQLATGASLPAVCAAPPLQRCVEPQFGERALLLARYERFRALYPSLRAQF